MTIVRPAGADDQKRALAREITRVVHETIGAPAEYIYVLIREQLGRDHIKGGKHLPEYEHSRGT